MTSVVAWRAGFAGAKSGWGVLAREYCRLRKEVTMPAERLPMRKTYEILRLLWGCGLTGRETARACQVSNSTVVTYQRRARAAGLESWEDVVSLDELELEARLFPAPPGPGTQRPLPDWRWIHEELQRPGVTLQLLWEEYKSEHPEDGLHYSRFCDLYREFRGRLDLSMRQAHKAGEKLFVDYCGQTVPVIDAESGETREAAIFVAVLGASNYTYAEATWTQQLPDWIGSHQRGLKYFGGSPAIVVPDNLRSGVTRACRYEPELNRTYEDLAQHYGMAVIPARVRRPRDKAKVEAGVLVVERWILAALRHRQFFSLGELNAAIRELLERLNTRPFRKLPGSRRSRFEALDRPALQALPATRYEYAEWSSVRVRRDYHVDVDAHAYSVPHPLVGKQLDVRLTADGVELLDRSRRVACHPRSHEVGGSTTLREHMPRGHRELADWTPEKLLAWAQGRGAHTGAAAEQILHGKPHLLQGLRAALGLRSLAQGYGEARLEAACARALRLGAVSYSGLRSMLQRGLESHPVPPDPGPLPALEHGNLRGAAYYRLAEEGTPC